jgi:DNA processing protein
VVYPAENRKITDQILASGGAILSEFPLGTFPAPQNFPIRNRLISGIAIGVLVLEAGEFSGTRVTARCALEQGREVFAVPGNVTNKLSWGPNTLIKQGAALVATWEDVWEALPADVRLALTPPEPPASEEGVPSSLFEAAQLPPSEKRIYALMRADESISYRPIGRAPGVVPLLVRDLQRLVRVGAERPHSATAGEIFCEDDVGGSAFRSSPFAFR